MEQGKPIEQLKKFNFFLAEQIAEQVNDPRSHPIRLTDINVTDIGLVKSKYIDAILFLDETTNSILVFSKCVEGTWQPHSEATHRMLTTQHSEIILTLGEDAENQMKSMYVKLWIMDENITDYASMRPKKSILIGKLGQPQKIISSLHLMSDLSLLSLGTKRGSLLLFQSRNLLQYDYKSSTKLFDKKQIKLVQAVKRQNQFDVYFSNEQSLFWFENLSEKRRIVQAEVQILESTRSGNILLTFKNDNKYIYEYRGGKQIKSHYLEGVKKIIKEFKTSYLIVVTYQKKNQKLQKSSDKYFVQILDTVNQYIAYNQTFSKVQSVLTNEKGIILIVLNQKGERLVISLSQKDNSFKIQTFFKRSFYQQAWRFAKNQNCQESLLAEISRLHGDLLWSKNDFANSIQQYILTLGYVEPSYVIRRFLDVSQIDYLILYLQKIHEKKLAKKQHTALLLNCYVKKQKIQNLSSFLSESSLESDLFDIQTAIKVCKDLNHYDEAMKLAQQKNKHELYLKILIQNKKDYEKALEYIRIKVPLEEKQKYLIQFGQQFMKFTPAKTIELIKLLIRAHSISQIVRGKQRDYVLPPDQKYVFEQLHFDTQELQSLTIITFKKPDEFFRLFMVNNSDLQNFLIYLIKDVPKLPHQQIVFHRLIEFYLQMMKESPSRKEEFSAKILQNLQNTTKKPDNNVLLSLFKMYDYDDGIINLCKKLGMRDDLLNFYIAKNRDKDIMDLCKEHGVDQVNLWIHALKYFVKPELRKEYFIPEILEELSKINNLSPLPVLSILSKSKNIEYQYIKNFFLKKLKQDRQKIERDRQVVKKNIKKAQESRNEYRKLKTTAKPFLSNNCSSCQNGLTFPSLYFMCGHAFHQNCLSGDKECIKCKFDMKNIMERKERYAQGAKDQRKLFETLQQRKQNAFQVVSEYLGKNLFVKNN